MNFNIANINEEWDKRNMRLINSLIFALLICSFLFSLINFKLGVIESSYLALSITAITFSHFLFFYKLDLIFIKTYFCIIPIVLTFLLAVFFVGKGGGDKYYLLNTLMLPLVVFKEKKRYLPIVILNIVCFFIIEYFQKNNHPFLEFSNEDLEIYFLITTFLIFVFSYLIISLFKKEIFSFQKTIRNQKKVLESKNKEIIDSLKYAKGIQEAILPSTNFINNNFKDGFVLYLPKDIVAGDFYWVEKENDFLYFSAADCTGHGVPGAMVSLVCERSLNESLREYNKISPNDILEKTSELVSATFSKSEREIKDGMDISICRLNLESYALEYSGANNPLWIISENKVLNTISDYKTVESNGTYLHEIKGTKRSVGNSYSKSPFDLHEVKLVIGDRVVLLTDGYPDQFGGAKGKKFKYLPLKKLILEATFGELNNELEKSFNLWKHDLEQVDDVCIVGYEIK